MLFSRVVSFFAFAATFGGLAIAHVVSEKRDTASVQQAVANLKSTTDSIVPQIEGLIANNNATDATVGPLMSELITAINNARKDALSSAPALAKRQSTSAIANDVTAVITAVTKLVTDLNTVFEGVPILGTLLPELDVALTTLLTSLASVVAGVLSTVVGLLGTVTGLLGGLGLTNLGGLLGLLGLL